MSVRASAEKEPREVLPKAVLGLLRTRVAKEVVTRNLNFRV